MNSSIAGSAPLYSPSLEHDGCGVGFLASLEGERSHRIVQLAVRALVNLTHRGAVSADAASGDGAGITVEVPHALLAQEAERLGLGSPAGRLLAVAMVFLPRGDEESRAARSLLSAAVRTTGIDELGWRVVPVDASALGGVALETLPRIEQLLLMPGDPRPEDEFERALYLARRRAEAAFREARVEAYIASMSARTVVYKGLMVAPQLERFYPDLADRRTRSSFALFHQRFATNTLPDWSLAQPFRILGHNGEINTLLGNRNWLRAREPELTSEAWGDDLRDLLPITRQMGSDTASLDEVIDLLTMSGRDLLTALAMLIPEAWEAEPRMDPALRAFYQHAACLTEPWDGPAAVVATDGRLVAAAMDRNGLRPARYQVLKDGLVIVSSEVGVLETSLTDVVESGRIGPGQMIAVDTKRGAFWRNDEVKRRVARSRPYEEWVRNRPTLLPCGSAGAEAAGISGDRLVALQVVHGYTKEEIALVLSPMAETGGEATASMGDDTPLSALSDNERSLYTYFRQRFAQVTNPPIDPIRERVMMSLDTYLGRRRSLLDPSPDAAELVRLADPILTEDDLRRLEAGHGGLRVATVDARFRANDGVEGLSRALARLRARSNAAADAGHDVLVVSDIGVDAEFAPIPMLLAVSTVHHHLIRCGQRMRISLIAQAGDARDVHHFAALIGFGASAVHPYLALATLASFAEEGPGLAEKRSVFLIQYLQAVRSGILKIMSKMGIATISSYHGAQIFEALGIDAELTTSCFPGTTSRIGGIGLDAIARDAIARHRRAFEGGALDQGSWYRYRRDGDYHSNGPPVWRALHGVAQRGDADQYRAYADLVHSRPPTALRDLLVFTPNRPPVALDRVEPVEEITRRFRTGAMSLGALSAEAHEDVARAMNRIGGLANTGEGGEDPRRYLEGGDKRDAESFVKQVASGRFGVTTAYLAAARELEIKISQGSKPGEGGQLPGGKVSDYIASLRYVQPGTTLISPPPHHDIYSIEDLAQLIYDLKAVNPQARVCVKLVASEGVGTIAAGVAKAYADVIQISGADGGTGASPLSSIKYAGAPWELGLAETQQTLVVHALRDRVRLVADGGFHTGRDVVVAALLGAEEFGFGTAALIALGCKMARQCHVNTCPVGIATQAEELRAKYFGEPEMLVRFLTYVADEVRETIAGLGYTELRQIVGRADLLRQIPGDPSRRWRSVDLSRITSKPRGGALHSMRERNDPPGRSLDHRILDDLGPALEEGLPYRGSFPIRNTDRTVGGRISGTIARRHGDRRVPAGLIELRFTGSAGQSFGAWNASGLHLHLCGEANDYVGKGMSGGRISICAPEESVLRDGRATLVGNTVLYGATGGSLFVAGGAGERFAVRNSGAHAVVEGVGLHGCEYMTGGVVVVLGRVGANFGAGMSGGVAFVLDEEDEIDTRLNPALVRADPVARADDVALLRDMIERHEAITGSWRARQILQSWSRWLRGFRRVAPIDSSTVSPSPPEERQLQIAETTEASDPVPSTMSAPL